MRHCPACGQLDDFDHMDCRCRLNRALRRLRWSTPHFILTGFLWLVVVPACLFIWIGH